MRAPTLNSDNREAALAHAGTAGEPATTLTFRFATEEDAAMLARLAALDSSTIPAQPVLLAEVGGELHAAMSLSQGRVVADPFRPTAELTQLLRARARQLNPGPQNSRYRRLGLTLERRFLPGFS